MNKRRFTTPTGLLLLLLVSTLFLLGAEADGRNQAGLVVDYGGGQVETVCVNFAGEDISGFDLLQQSGLAMEIDAQGIGAAVCRIGETGCPAGNCFCQCRGNECAYWSYWHQVNGAWEYSAAGAGAYRVQPGAVDGWTWGPSSVTEAVEPPLISFAEICAVPPPQPVGAGQPPAAATDQGAELEVSWLLYVLIGVVVGGLIIGAIAARRADRDHP